MRRQTYTATIGPRPRGGQVIPVLFDPDAVWGEKDQHYVTGTVAGMPVRGSLTTFDGAPAMLVGPSWCRHPSVAPGRVVEVILEPEGPQFDDLPEELATALLSDPDARRRFESLATFYRKAFVDPIESAKGADTRERRSAQVVEALRAGRKTYR